ncbi:hypothetical protein FisN_21Lh096 [Fistulifera solaris]|uniref:Sucrose phosphatase-like domain-containing protein n=1 Tax=Fistulifera solaris TaxID=1519565 RepID=A0A1Z5KK35_FISSO|nr:hypothetical protein FisN_21Lh096 [Fistulifera solaris]|eukprot:GAX26626.1 hypothetical protein FisN_21Lh096 [Fistulifera solaris]
MTTSDINTNVEKPRIRIVFSDLDGTLIHYPTDAAQYAREHSEPILQLPPSATGTRGVISAQTLLYAQELRKRGVKLVLISGMRTSTLISRLPFLPEADVYCTEAGGRIFYRVSPVDGQYTCQPVQYEGAQMLDKFGLQEDMEWRKRWEDKGAAGKEGFIGNELAYEQTQDPLPISQRSGLLWEFAASLELKDLVIDCKSYSTCFRVHRSQQSKQGEQLFDDLLNGKISCPPGLATSTNLGAIDFYPTASGKKNW